MYYYLNGTVAEIGSNLAVIDCGGVGYACATTNYTLAQLKRGERAKLFTFGQDAGGAHGHAHSHRQRLPGVHHGAHRDIGRAAPDDHPPDAGRYGYTRRTAHRSGQRTTTRRHDSDRLSKGEIDILVGTHAVIEDAVVFARLGLAVVDEQHRFGVAQRARLWAKSEMPPHILVMTATPIPRTLAMTLYGDLDVSVIDELPPGRKPIQTLHKYDTQTTSLYQGIRQQIDSGRQVYIVYPLIEESEKSDLKNLEDGFEAMREIFPQYHLSKVHGRMKPKDKDAEMQRFASGETQILVATTVIEVGVNVPNASVMVILDAQRFGLSQLHQLRGRVGRGAEQSYCILVTTFKLSEETRKRIDIMCETNDGFRIAEADLKLRGPGDLEGTQQSGIAFDLKIADIARDGQIVQLAREQAQAIIDRDPECSSNEYKMLWDRLKELRKSNVNWSAIS